MIFEGTAWRYGKNVDTDVIIPARYLTSFEPEELGKHCLEDLDPDFVKKVQPGDIIVADDNFGCGSSREQAPIAIKAVGIAAVIASSFARIFYRNAINVGLPILESAEAVQGIKTGDRIKLDIGSGSIENQTTGQSFRARPFPPFIQELIEKGGLIEKIKAEKRGIVKDEQQTS